MSFESTAWKSSPPKWTTTKKRLRLMPGPSRAGAHTANGQVAAAASANILVQNLQVVGVNSLFPGRFSVYRPVNQADRMMSEHAIEVDDRRPNDPLPHALAIAELGQIAWRGRQVPGKSRLEVAMKLGRHRDSAGGVLQALNGFQAADIVEEPTARCEHQHGILLHLEQAKRIGCLLFVNVWVAMLLEERLDGGR